MNSDDKIKNILGKKKKTKSILSGASIFNQLQWKSFSPNTKRLNRMLHKDSDKDRVPNRWDCQPLNRFRQDKPLSYLTNDELKQKINQEFNIPFEVLNNMNRTALINLHKNLELRKLLKLLKRQVKLLESLVKR